MTTDQPAHEIPDSPALSTQADLKWLMIDATIVRAHQHAAGARTQKGALMPRGSAAPPAA